MKSWSSLNLGHAGTSDEAIRTTGGNKKGLDTEDVESEQREAEAEVGDERA